MAALTAVTAVTALTLPPRVLCYEPAMRFVSKMNFVRWIAPLLVAAGTVHVHAAITLAQDYCDALGTGLTGQSQPRSGFHGIDKNYANPNVVNNGNLKDDGNTAPPGRYYFAGNGYMTALEVCDFATAAEWHGLSCQLDATLGFAYLDHDAGNGFGDDYDFEFYGSWESQARMDGLLCCGEGSYAHPVGSVAIDAWPFWNPDNVVSTGGTDPISAVCTSCQTEVGTDCDYPEASTYECAGQACDDGSGLSTGEICAPDGILYLDSESKACVVSTKENPHTINGNGNVGAGYGYGNDKRGKGMWIYQEGTCGDDAHAAIVPLCTCSGYAEYYTDPECMDLGVCTCDDGYYEDANGSCEQCQPNGAGDLCADAACDGQTCDDGDANTAASQCHATGLACAPPNCASDFPHC